MELYKDLAQFYDLLYSYKDYDKESGFIAREVGDLTAPKILDIACGTGSHLKSLRARFPKATLVGVDLNRDMLKIARKKNLGARLEVGDIRDFDLNENFNLAYCFSSSIQYMLSEEDFKRAIERMQAHAHKVIFDVAFCRERWKEGYTNITANCNENYQVAELFTSHSKESFSHWNPLYIIKNKRTGKIDMHIDKQKIRIWGISEIESLLREKNIFYKIKRGFKGKGNKNDIPLFLVEGFKKS